MLTQSRFLTQTRPQFVSPLAAKTPARFAASLRLSSPGSSLVSLSSARKPLSTLSQDLDDDDLPARRRLRKRSEDEPVELMLPPPTLKNAFDVLGKTRPSKPKGKIKRSEFIEGEAEESDDDRDFGFGVRKKEDDDEEEDGEDQDQVMAELVDDKEMDEATLAEKAVVEKHR